MQHLRITLQSMHHSQPMNQSHPLSQFFTAFFGLSLFTLIYVATSNRSVPVAPTHTQVVAPSPAR